MHTVLHNFLRVTSLAHPYVGRSYMQGMIVMRAYSELEIFRTRTE